MKLKEVRAFVDARVAEISQLDGLTVGDPYETAIIREIVTRAFIGGLRSGLQYRPDAELNKLAGIQVCRVCKCTASNCKRCIEKTGAPCWWVASDLCSACSPERASEMASEPFELER